MHQLMHLYLSIVELHTFLLKIDWKFDYFLLLLLSFYGSEEYNLCILCVCKEEKRRKQVEKKKVARIEGFKTINILPERQVTQKHLKKHAHTYTRRIFFFKIKTAAAKYSSGSANNCCCC
jgi:hypothetical protein